MSPFDDWRKPPVGRGEKRSLPSASKSLELCMQQEGIQAAILIVIPPASVLMDL